MNRCTHRGDGYQCRKPAEHHGFHQMHVWTQPGNKLVMAWVWIRAQQRYGWIMVG